MKKNASTIVIVLVLLVGLCVLLYPTVSDYWNSRTQTRAIVEYEAALAGLSKEDFSEELEKANSYNEKLQLLSYPLMNYHDIEGYKDILNVGHDNIIGYIDIEKIDVKLPIYHGTSDAVLNVAVGHLEGTSFPVGGESTHAVLSAHRGLPTAKLFSNLDKMELRDTFTVTVLDQVLVYEVDQILIVKPEEVDSLNIVEGEDHCSLVTCTPYGINTHRLIVRGTRIETSGYKPILVVPNDASIIDPIAVTPIVAAPMLFVLLIVLMVKSRKNQKKFKINPEGGGGDEA